MLRHALAATFTLALLAAPASAGPPWIAIEYPANPHHPSTRGALLLVRAYHHSESISAPVTGRAEGIVNGKRRSFPLEIRSTSTPGVYAVRSQVPADGTWVLAITLTQGENATASALVRMDEGRVAHVEVPTDQNREGWYIPRAITPRDVDRALGSATAEKGGAAKALLGVPLLLALAFVRRRASDA